MPEKDAVEKFWKDVWQNETSFNDKAEWLQQLEKIYYRNVTTTIYNIDRKMLDKVIKKIQINKAPSNDLINGYWYKSLIGYQDQLSISFNQQIHFDSPLTTWLNAAHTILLPKNTDTHIAKNYRSIACLNVMYKLYSSYINQCLMNHVYKNSIVTPEQTAGKKRIWGTVKELLINKGILKEVTQQTFVGLEDVFKMSWKTKHCYNEDVLKTCLEDVLKTCLEDVLRILWRQTKHLLGICEYLSGDNKSKCVSNKSIFHKSISGNSKANSKCIN